MAKFCTKCGSPVEESLSFCPQCGAQLSAPSSPARAPASQAAPSAAPQAASVAAAPVPAAPQKGSPVLMIILAVLGFFALVMVIGIGSCVYIGYRIKQKAEAFKQAIKVDESGKSVTFNTPQGPVTMGEIKPGEAAKSATQDVPAYPGSTPLQGGGGISIGGQTAFSGQEYETQDSVDQVVAFYKEKLGPKATIQESGGKAVLMVGSATGMTTVSIEPDEKSGKTKISIAHIGK